MNFNKLAGMLLAAFERVDAEDLFTALSALPSDLLEVRKIGKNLLQDIPLVKILGSSYYLVVFTILRSTLVHKKSLLKKFKAKQTQFLILHWKHKKIGCTQIVDLKK